MVLDRVACYFVVEFVGKSVVVVMKRKEKNFFRRKIVLH